MFSDRFCDAMISIYEEIKAIEEGKADKADNPLKHAPHTQAVVCAESCSVKTAIIIVISNFFMILNVLISFQI